MKGEVHVAPRIALQIEKNRAHGRALLKGIADYALENTSWRLELVDPQRLANAAYVASFDGLIVRVMDDATAETLLRARKPVVDTYGRIDDNPLASIRLDDAAIADMALQCFVEHHYHVFAYCGFGGLRFSDARGAAFKVRAERVGTFVASFGGSARHRIADVFFRNEQTTVPDAKALGKWLLALPKPIALFCCNDLRAMQVLTVCADVGVSVPSDVAVLGADNDVLLCTFTNPSLSSVETDPFSLGRRAAQMLDEQLQRSEPAASDAPPSVRHPPKRVVERMSTHVYPFRTPWLAEAVDYIRRNLAKGVTADDVVRHIGYSHPTVSRAFVAELGHSVKKEILCQRSRLACRLLKETSYSAGEVSARCGYRSPQYFSHCFAEAFGTPPDVWRKHADEADDSEKIF